MTIVGWGGRAAGGWARGLGARLRGPGGWYNLGSALGLAVGLGVQVAASRSGEAGQAALDHLAGSGAALALTGATLVLLLSGEAYHRAWADARRPDARWTQRGDVLSAAGALGLMTAAAALGQGVLAAAGVVHVGARLASAAGLPSPRAWPPSWPDPYRAAVSASRLPALGGAAWAAWAGVGAGPERLIPPALVLCTLLWLRADLMMVRGPRAGRPAAVPS